MPYLSFRRHIGSRFIGVTRDAPNPKCLQAGNPLLDADPQIVLALERQFHPVERAIVPSNGCIHALFESCAAQCPDATALSFENRHLTYGELNARANRLAHRLRKLGVGPDVLVALCLDRSWEMVIAVLGVLKAGGAYVPLDSSYPAESLAFQIEDSQPHVLITQERLCSHLGRYRGTVLILDSQTTDMERESDANPDTVNEPENLAYVIYTSGSTGRPKGVLVTHGNLAQLFASTKDLFRFSPNDVWTLFHSFAFDFSVWELWGALAFGGRLVIVPYGLSRSPRDFRKLLIDEKVTVLNQTPSAFRQLVDCELAEMPAHFRLRLVIFGGETLDAASVNAWFERYGDSQPRLVNGYGITETTVFATFHALRKSNLALQRGHVIGSPIPQWQIYLLDAEGRTAAEGEIGEIYVGGAGVSRGYLNRPALTAERFLPDPFAPGAMMYRSGDLARRTENGDLLYVGRSDDQVKISGYRIEPGEIEIVLQEHPGVRHAVVVPHGSGEARALAAYVVSRGRISLAGLREHLRDRLPPQMIPASITLLDTLPLTVNGKLDRQALPPPDPRGADRTHSFESPRTAVETILADSFAEILDRNPIGIHDDFFLDHGGNSLQAVRLAECISRRLKVTLRPGDLFRCPTVTALAELLNDAMPIAARILNVVRPGRGRNPVVIVGWPSVVGWMLKALPADVPVWTIPQDGLETDRTDIRSVAVEAAEHFAELQALLPHGPLTVIGFSYYGLVAFEIARRLREAGRTANLLILEPSERKIFREGEALEGLELREKTRVGSRLNRLHWCIRLHLAYRWKVWPPGNLFREWLQRPVIRLRVACGLGLPLKYRNWWYFEPQFFACIRGHATAPCAGEIHLAARRIWFEACLARWQELAAPGQLITHSITQARHHNDLADSSTAEAWIGLIRDWAAREES